MKHKYISRIDSGNTHCYFLRILEKRDDGIRKAFSDGMFGGKRKALLAAVKFRDEFLKRFPIDISVHRKAYTFPCFRSKGYYFGSRKRETVDNYEYCTAYCYDKFDHICHEKMFGFVTWGGKKKARQKAIAWRNKMRMMVEKKALALGIKR